MYKLSFSVLTTSTDFPFLELGGREAGAGPVLGEYPWLYLPPAVWPGARDLIFNLAELRGFFLVFLDPFCIIVKIIHRKHVGA